MASRRRRPSPKSFYRNPNRDLTYSDPFEGSYSSRLTSSGPVISLRTYLPPSVARRARGKIYPYPRPLQRALAARVIRKKLRRRHDLVPAIVRVRLPRIMPLARPSYVSINRGRLNIHSRKQLASLMARREKNRRRYDEGKTNHRKARHGQLDSPGATAYGALAESVARRRSISQIADAATGARAVWKGRR